MGIIHFIVNMWVLICHDQLLMKVIRIHRLTAKGENITNNKI